MKKTVKDNVFGKITYKDGVWTGTSTINICVCDRPQEVMIEIESVNEIYDEINLGIMDKTIADIIIKNSNEYDEEQTIKDKIKQQQLFEELIIKKIK